MKKVTIIVAFLLVNFAIGTVSAITVQVDPVSGTDNGSSPFLTIPAALTAVVGADSSADVVNLRTNGLHNLTAQLVVNVASADGDLTIQTDSGDSGSAIIRLSGSGAPQIELNADGDRTLLISGVTFIGGSGTGGVGGDGTASFNSNTGLGTATINFTDCVFAANNGSDQPVPYEQPFSATSHSYPDDDWVDYFPDTQGTLTNCKISHAGDEGLIIRGVQTTGTNGAHVTVTGNSVISHCGGRAVQPAFGGSGTPDNPVVTLQGSVSERIRIFGNCVANAEPTLTLFDGFVTLQYVDIVNNNDLGIRVDTDTLDSFTMEYCRIANNGLSAADPGQGGQGIWFGWTTADLSNATISNCTFHDSNKDVAMDVTAAVTSSITVNVTDTIFTGSGDQINLATGNTAVVNFANCALVSQPLYNLGSPIYSDLSPTSESNTISKSPYYVSVYFDPTDAQNADYLRVTDLNSEYLTGSSTSGELVGGNGLSIVHVEPPTRANSAWNLYQ